MSDVYRMAVGNVARAIHKQDTSKETPLNAFDAAVYLAAAFCKCEEDVLADILIYDPTKRG